MINNLLAERLTKTEQRVHLALVVLILIWVIYCRIMGNGPVAWLDGIQLRLWDDGTYYPKLSLILALGLFIPPLAALFLLYAWLKRRGEAVNQMEPERND
jgi:hypothetical protein